LELQILNGTLIFNSRSQQTLQLKNDRLSLDEIKKKVDELALKINAPDNLLPGYGQLKYEAHPYIEMDNRGLMYFVISERGEVNERKKTDQLDDLLYWIFADVTFSMACDFELKNRIEDKDSRRLIFEKQEELLGILSNTWPQIENKEHKNILKNNPFDDLAGVRATYCGELRKKGYSESEITKLAYDRYPAN